MQYFMFVIKVVCQIEKAQPLSRNMGFSSSPETHVVVIPHVSYGKFWYNSPPNIVDLYSWHWRHTACTNVVGYMWDISKCIYGNGSKSVISFYLSIYELKMIFAFSLK